MTAGYSGTPLWKKIGLKVGTSVVAVNMPPDVRRLVDTELPGITWLKRSRDIQVAWIFATQIKALSESLAAMRKGLQPTGFIWVSWPKQASGVVTDISENRVRDVALLERLVDVKVCAVTEVWSGLKLVVRIKDR